MSVLNVNAWTPMIADTNSWCFYVIFILYLNKTYKQDNFYKIVIFTFTTQRFLLEK